MRRFEWRAAGTCGMTNKLMHKWEGGELRAAREFKGYISWRSSRVRWRFLFEVAAPRAMEKGKGGEEAMGCTNAGKKKIRSFF